VVAVLVVIAILLAIVGLRTRGRRSAPGIRPLPANLVEPYESRLPEIERLFVNQPREAVAAAKLLVDDMLNRMGYPVRMANEERVRDLRGRRRAVADLYKQASGLKSDPTTEQLRQSLQRYLEIARKLLDEAIHQEPHEVA
jgi:hypothetical protein